MKTCIVGNRYLRKAFVRMIGSCCLYHHEHTMIVTRGNGLCDSLPETNAVTRRRRKERVGRERLVIIIRVAAVGASDSEGTSESGGGCGAGGGTATGWGKVYPPGRFMHADAYRLFFFFLKSNAYGPGLLTLANQ